MKTVGIFKAKTKLSELCREVAETGKPIVIQRRGKPIAQIGPMSDRKKKKEGKSDILEDMRKWNEENGAMPEDEPDFPDVWKMRGESWHRDPFGDYWNDPRPWDKT